jgi:hypothetical protein
MGLETTYSPNPNTASDWRTKSSLDKNSPLNVGNPNVATFGNTEVITNKPIITKRANYVDYKAKGEEFRANQRLQEKLLKDKNPSIKTTWWGRKTKTQKALIIGGGSVAVLLATFLIYRASKNTKK